MSWRVGNIIVTTGYEPMDASRIERYAYGKFPNVITALEFERLSNASGPTGGKILLKEEEAQQADQAGRMGLRA